ncbi:MAG: hypothetical protein EPN91_02455 [Salinibacterium sp.]|nr:MAG: hypothetical protein EPN91_02455 [Salinibacterium sp.]
MPNEKSSRFKTKNGGSIEIVAITDRVVEQASKNLLKIDRINFSGGDSDPVHVKMLYNAELARLATKSLLDKDAKDLLAGKDVNETRAILKNSDLVGAIISKGLSLARQEGDEILEEDIPNS